VETELCKVAIEKLKAGNATANSANPSSATALSGDDLTDMLSGLSVI
jgi:hypothetical protein